MSPRSAATDRVEAVYRRLDEVADGYVAARRALQEARRTLAEKRAALAAAADRLTGESGSARAATEGETR